MNEAFVLKFLKKQRFESFFYSAEIFECRLKEERYRAHELNTSFCYLELPFNGLLVEDVSPEIQEKTWDHLLKILPTCLRGSDIRGFLPGNTGIGIVLLDCSESALSTFFHRLRQHLAEYGLDVALNHAHEIMRRSYFYPNKVETES